MPDLYKDMFLLHRKFKLNGCNGLPPRLLSEEEFDFRLVCLREEVLEYENADTLVKQIDALIDLTMFSLGTLERMGVDLEPHWDAVLLSNFRKELHSSKEDSKRNFAGDLKKPEGWVEPDHDRILKTYKNNL